MSRTGCVTGYWLGLLLLTGGMYGCGGGGSSPKNPPDFAIQISASSLALVLGGAAQSVTLTATALNGFTGSISVTETGVPAGVTVSPSSFSLSPGGSQVVSLTAGAGAAAKPASVAFAGASGGAMHTATLAITINSPPDFAIQISASSLALEIGGASQSVTLSATALNGFTGSISVTGTGVPAGVTVSPSSFSLSPGGSQVVSLTAGAAAVATPASIVFVATSGAISHAATLALTINAPPDFAIQISASGLTLVLGGAAQSVTLTATALNDFSGSISVTETGVPAGVAVSPSSFSLSAGGSQRVSLTAGAAAAAKPASVVFVATSGAITHTATLALSIKAPPGIDVVTYHYDAARTGLNASETTLTPANVTSAKFGLLRMLPVDGKVDAQPLYLSNLDVGGQLHNVVYAVTEHDSVYAFDADTGTQLWKASVLEASESPSDNHRCSQITPEIGITSTPVIDRAAGPNGTIFVVGMSVDSSHNYHQRLHALDVSTGAELQAPTEIRATYPGTGANSSNGMVVFDPYQYAERVGLLLLNGVIYMGWTSHCDQEPYTGWLMGYSESTLMQTSVLNLTPNGSEGSIWMSGTGLAADSAGNIYFLDANGTFDAQLNASGFPVNGDFGNGFLKVSTSGGKVAVADYFEPYNTESESDGDLDLGSGGVLLLPDIQDVFGTTRHLAVGAGKDGKIYVVDRDNMGKFNGQNNDAIYQEIDRAISSVFSLPGYFDNTVYYASWGNVLKAFRITNARLASTPAAVSINAFPYPGATPAISANGTSNGIVWAIENSSPAVLHAYDAGTLEELYNSKQAANGRDSFGNGNKFITPLVVDGKVFAGTPNAVAEFGLLQ